jgi:hypothetical protein
MADLIRDRRAGQVSGVEAAAALACAARLGKALGLAPLETDDLLRDAFAEGKPALGLRYGRPCLRPSTFGEGGKIVAAPLPAPEPSAARGGDGHAGEDCRPVKTAGGCGSPPTGAELDCWLPGALPGCFGDAGLQADAEDGARLEGVP